MSTPPRSRLFDSANHHLDDPTVLQAGIDLELNGLPADHAFHDLSHTGIPLVCDVAVLAHVRERGESYRPEQSRIFLEKGLNSVAVRVCCQSIGKALLPEPDRRRRIVEKQAPLGERPGRGLSKCGGFQIEDARAIR